MYHYNQFYIAVDFDDTCVLSRIKGLTYPEFDGDIPGAVQHLRYLACDAKLILLTCREGEALADAIKWFVSHGIPLCGINKNPDPYWQENKTTKVYADLIIDDKCVGLPMTSNDAGLEYPDWNAIYFMAKQQIIRWKLNHQ